MVVADREAVGESAGDSRLLLDRPRGTSAALNSLCKYPGAQGSTMLKADKNHVTGQERDRRKKGK